MNKENKESVYRDIQSDRDVREIGGVTSYISTRALRFTSSPGRVWMHPDAAIWECAREVAGYTAALPRWMERRAAGSAKKYHIFHREDARGTRIRGVISTQGSHNVMNTLSEGVANCLKNKQGKQTVTFDRDLF